MVRYIDITPGLMMQDLTQVKQAAVEQIRTARQTGEEACWHCGRPATETCSGNFLFRIFLGLGWVDDNHDNHDNDDIDDDGDDDDVERRFKHCAGCSLARYCGQLCQHKVKQKLFPIPNKHFLFIMKMRW